MTRLKNLLTLSNLPAALILLFITVFGYKYLTANPTDIHRNAAMITNRAVTHGGTGVVYSSTSKGSYVLTNDHVCRAVQSGGVIKVDSGTYQIQSILESDVSDLCFLFTPGNLGLNTRVAKSPPRLFDSAKAVGHPALMPTVISTGEFSDKAIIQVVIGMKPCTEEQLKDPGVALMCFFAGGIPIIKSYESQLVTSTIMPGSSGSGVYNDANELTGLVFAGSGDFGYAWTVPYDQLVQFLNVEAQKPKWVNVDQEVHAFDNNDEAHNFRNVLKKCNVETDERFVTICNLLRRDMTWVK